MNEVFRLADLFQRFFTGMVLELIKDHSGKKGLWVAEKGHGEKVSELDMALDGAIAAFFRRHLPETLVVSEEGFVGEFPDSDFVMVDPLDGTHNFLMGLPLFGSMLVWVHEGKPISSMVFLPAKQLLSGNGFHFTARGHGAWQYGPGGWERIFVSNLATLEKARLLVDGPSNVFDRHALVRKIKPRVARWRAPGASCWAGTLVATGGMVPEGADCIVSIGSKPWDNLPIALLVEEAGGKVTDLGGRPYDLQNCSELVFSNGILHEEILRERKEEVL